MVERQAQQPARGGVEIDDAALGIGDDHAFGEGAEGFAHDGGHKGGFDRGAVGGQVRAGGEEADEAGDAEQLAFAVELAHGAKQRGGVATVGAAQAQHFHKRVAGGAAVGEKPMGDAELGGVGREHRREAFGSVEGAAVVEAGEGGKGLGDPAFAAGREVDLERAERAAFGEHAEAFVVGDAGLLEFLALGDVAAHADGAYDGAGCVNVLHARALHPDVVSAPMPEAKLCGERVGAGLAFAGGAIGRRRGVVGVQVREPALVGVGQFGGHVAEQLLPRRRVAGGGGGEVEIEEAQRTLLDETAERLVFVGGGGRRHGGGGRGDDGGEKAFAGGGGFEVEIDFGRVGVFGRIGRFGGRGATAET